MWFRRLPVQAPGKPIAAQTLRLTTEAAEWATRIRADAPLKVISTGFGPLIRYAGPIFGAYVAVSGGISARSGSTPGSGTATIQTWTGSTLADMTGSGATPTVLNISSATGGIASGKYMILLKISGTYWVITAEC
jgi:hypothetical protein